MCGIFGMVCKDGEKPDEVMVKKAIDRLAHRGPDDSGCFFAKNIALANRRLAILDLSDKGHQPMHYRYATITYNGELYNYMELRRELSKLGHVFNTKTDTEIVLAAYLEWGKDCVHRFNGMWAFAIYDPRKALLFCSRDRFGIKPFYYTWLEDRFVFASEIKAFTVLPQWQAMLDEQMASDYLCKGLQNHTDRTLFKNVHQLLPGHHLVFELKAEKVQTELYYDVGTIAVDEKITFQEAAIKFRELLKSAVQLHSRSDVKVGSALSGGLDSSAIVALQYELLRDKSKDFSVVSYTSDLPQFDESAFVKSFLEKHALEVHWTTASFAETMDLVDEVILAHDEPLLSASLIAQYGVFKKAGEKQLKVMLDGQGADELLAGYGTYYMPFLKEIGLKQPLKLLKEIVGLLGKHQIKTSKKVSFFKKGMDYQQLLNLPEQTTSQAASGFRNYTDYMIQQGILPALLQFEDRNSMAHSVESRVPFLDYRLVEFCLSLPPTFKIRKGVRKAVLREAMKAELPEKILKRYDKMGFSTPQEAWMSQNPEVFLQMIRESIAENPAVFSPDLVSFAHRVLFKKQSVHYPFLWRILTFGRWLEIMHINTSKTGNGEKE